MSYAQLAAAVQELNQTNLVLVDSVQDVQETANEAVQTAQQAMQAIAALGSPSVMPAPNQVPRANAQGKILAEWLPEEIVRQSQLQAVIDSAAKVRAHAPMDFVVDFGGIPDVDDPIVWEKNAVALQAASDYCMAYGRALRFSGHTFYFGNNTSTVFTANGVGNLIWYGMGKGLTTLKYNDHSGASRRDFIKGSAVNVGLFDFKIEGSWGENNDYTQRSHLVALTFTEGYVAQRLHVNKSRYMSATVSGGKTAHVSDSWVTNGAADGFRCTNVNSITMVDNFGQSVNDDWLACHWTDNQPSPVDRRVYLSGNISIDSQGICVLGAKNTIITRNIGIRPHTRACLVGCTDVTDGSSTEGNTPPMSLKITGNVFMDLFRGSDFSTSTGAGLGWIVLRNTAPRQGSAPGFVGGPDGAGGIVQPYDYLYQNNVDALDATNPGSWFIDISDNLCIRTLKPVSAYSNYGFGLRMGRSGPVDPEITQASLDAVGTQIRIQGQGTYLTVDRNMLFGGYIPLWFNGASTGTNINWKNVYARFNMIANFRGAAGIRASGDGFINMVGNVIDGDPFLTHSLRGTVGNWLAGYGGHSAFWLEAVRARVTDSTIKNVGSIFAGATLDRVLWERNTLICNPSALNYSVNNVGIGDIGTPARLDASFVIEDGNPNSSTFGSTLNICLKGATAIPTNTDKYVAGHRLRKSGAVIATDTDGKQYIVDEWLRYTTGTSHVLGVDWLELRKYIG